MVLGLDLEWTVGDIREDMLAQVKSSLTEGGAAMGVMPGGASKREYLDYHVRSSLAEGSRFDLIAMGRGEGQGCYCAVNHNLREVIDGMSKHYAYVVIDNEAGMEHLSRRTTRDVQHLFIVSDPTQRGLVAAQRIADMRKELEYQRRECVSRSSIVCVGNCLLNQGLHRQNECAVAWTIPANEDLAEFEFSGKPLVELGG